MLVLNKPGYPTESTAGEIFDHGFEKFSVVDNRHSHWLGRGVRPILGRGISLYFRARVLSNLAVTALLYTHTGDAM